MNLNELLAALTDLDNAAEISVEPDIIEAELAELSTKVDSIKKVLDRLNFEAERLAQEAEKIEKAAAQVTKNADALEDWVKFSMKTHGFTKLPGNTWNLQLKRTAPKVITKQEPTAEIAVKYPGIVLRDVKWRWDKKKIKEAIESGQLFEYGHLQEGMSLSFPPRKG